MTPAAKRSQPAGVACPGCACPHVPVIYTRHRHDRIIRARRCRHCGRRFMTTERVTAEEKT